VITDGETGALCPVGDVGAMADAAIATLIDRARWNRMSAAAAADARARFSLERILAQYEALYADAVPA
jgi:glycosyltransferase involved in cell wall biosynthesis